MEGIIVTLLLLLIGGGAVLLGEIADIHKRIRQLDSDVFDVDVTISERFTDMEKYLKDTNKSIQEIADVQAQPQVSESSDDFALRIEQIKNELGLRTHIADAHKEQRKAIPLHPNVYNIEETDQRAYENTTEVEYAR